MILAFHRLDDLATSRRFSLLVLASVIAPASTLAAGGEFDGSYGTASHCSTAAARDVDMIRIDGNEISDIEDSCEMIELDWQSDGIVTFTARCSSDVWPRTSDGFIFILDKGSIILDYGLGPAIWQRCSLP